MADKKLGHITIIMKIFLGVFVVVSGCIMYNVYQIQKAYEPPLDNQFVEEERFRTDVRGDILDRNGRVLACSVPEYEVYFDPRVEFFKKNPDLIEEKIDSISEGLARIFNEEGHDKKYYAKKIRDAKSQGKMLKLHNKNVDYNTLQALKKLPLFRNGAFKGGFSYITINNRVYPFGGIARRTLGSTREEKGREKGINGLENYYDEVLNGNVQSQNPDHHYDENSADQINVVSTIDADIQTIAHEELSSTLNRYKAEWGCVVVMEVETGEILAMSNLSHNDNPEDTNFYENMNYAATYRCDPGSTIKLPSLMIALEDKCIKLDDVVNTGDGVTTYINGALTVTDWNHKNGGFHELSVLDVFANSSNVGVSKLIDKNYVSTHREWDYIERLRQMKLDQESGVDLQNEPKPVVKDPSMTKGSIRWEKTTLLQMSYGYDLSITPLQILTFYNAVANGGKRVKPRLVKELHQGATCIKQYEKQENGTICSKETLKKAYELLESVVERGTAKNQKSKYYRIAGKTGTAQTYQGGYNKGKLRGSFCGFFPADKPKYSCIVVIQSNDTYNYNAVPVFRKIADRIYFMDPELRNSMVNDTSSVVFIPRVSNGYSDDFNKIFDELNIKEDYGSQRWVLNEVVNNEVKTKSATYVQGIMPNFNGMGMRDVLYLTDSLKLKVHCTGFGRLRRQSVKPGTPYKSGDVVVLEFGNER